MPRAWCLVRDQPHYRREAFVSGLAASGYTVQPDAGGTPDAGPGDLVVGWNRYGWIEQIADAVEARGATFVCAENGYIQGRHDGGSYYALAIHGHNGSGTVRVGGPERWDALGVQLKPWRTEGKHILVAANRSFGMRGFIMPDRWGENTAEALRKLTQREVRLRLHPGNNRPAVPLENDLRDAHAVVIWSSSVGVKALIEGIPVVCCAPWWICKKATLPLDAYGAAIDSPIAFQCDESADIARQYAMEELAWSQFSVAEIASGWPFQWLISGTNSPDSHTKEEAAHA